MANPPSIYNSLSYVADQEQCMSYRAPKEKRESLSYCQLSQRCRIGGKKESPLYNWFGKRRLLLVISQVKKSGLDRGIPSTLIYQTIRGGRIG